MIVVNRMLVIKDVLVGDLLKKRFPRKLLWINTPKLIQKIWPKYGTIVSFRVTGNKIVVYGDLSYEVVSRFPDSGSSIKILRSISGDSSVETVQFAVFQFASCEPLSFEEICIAMRLAGYTPASIKQGAFWDPSPAFSPVALIGKCYGLEMTALISARELISASSENDAFCSWHLLVSDQNLIVPGVKYLAYKVL